MAIMSRKLSFKREDGLSHESARWWMSGMIDTMLNRSIW